MACGNMRFIRLILLEIACVKHFCDVCGELSLQLMRQDLADFLHEARVLKYFYFRGREIIEKIGS